ncbi:RrF2 family transcriptional regulator [Chrysiogenes arsenatis]|uniref:RrF2 family transcriptional regulator n=1 Tax=Chrysiogenes arsenatis TaxID=309797 RepID=UPI00041610CF|nr:Rrf2 family transcriptional regulator [Chrysiogenes arsenatis]
MASLIRRETDYAIRIVAYLAGRKGERVKIFDICDRLFLSKPIVIKIIQQLKRGDIVEAKTGKAGGVMLSADPETLSIYDIMVAMDNQSSINSCNDAEEKCELQPLCRISRFLKELQGDVIRQFQAEKMSQLVFLEKDLEKLHAK